MSQFHQGLLPDTPEDRALFDKILADAQGSPMFGDVAGHLRGSGAGKLITPYKSVQKFDPRAFAEENQTTGDCTSHACRNAKDLARACDIDIKKQPEEWVARGATEYIYAHRGHGGEGMSVARAGQLLKQYGFLTRQKYPFIDLSKYNSSIGARLGRSGVPREWIEEMRKHPFGYFTRAERPEDVRDALANGYGVFRGAFKFAVQNRRDQNGIAHRDPRNGWAHAQAVIGWDDVPSFYTEPLVHEANSWGPWNAGGHPPWGPIPAGSYLMPLSEWVRYVFNQQQVYILGDPEGYPAKELPDYGTGDWL